VKVDRDEKATSIHPRSVRGAEVRALLLAVNLALAFTYALVIALGIDQFLARRKRREKSSRQ
jgi:hypothetical protein